MKLILRRIAKKPTYTIGRLFLMKDGKEEYLCDTLEDTVRVLEELSDKVPGRTAIPAGEYSLSLTYSNRFKRFLPLVEDVPFFAGIRIHAGNSDVDTEGCLLVGKNKNVGTVSKSVYTLECVILPLFRTYSSEKHSILIC